MKPNFRSLFRTALPAFIVVPCLVQPVFAGVLINDILPDAAGDVLVAGDYDEINGTDWTVQASGGNASPFTVTIEQGAILTGNPESGRGVNVTSSSYSIFNHGSLNAGSYGIFTMAGDTIIENSATGVIEGRYNGISFDAYDDRLLDGFNAIEAPEEGGSLLNHGEVHGDNIGVSGGSDLSIVNSETGVISGGYGSGISAGDNLDLINDGTITGLTENRSAERVSYPIYRKGGAAVFAGSDASIINNGTITAEFGHGICSFSNLELTNTGTIEGNGNYQEYTEFLTVEGETMANGSGVYTGDNALIDNQLGGLISGSLNGVTATGSLVLTNAGKIIGSSEEGGFAGVQTFGATEITNTGEIIGDQNGIVISNGQLSRAILPLEESEEIDELEGFTSMIANAGTITGTSGTGILGSDQVETVINQNGIINGAVAAIDLAGGDDVINLAFGSVINGDIVGGEGNDVINFTSGAEAVFDPSNIVHGNVGGIETINKTGPGFAFIGGVGESFNVFSDTINISSGGLVINGNLASLGEGKTIVNLTNGGKLDGTGIWKADLFVSSGGISAGGTNIQLDGYNGGVIPLRSSIAPPIADGTDSVGTLTLYGNVNGEGVVVDPPIPDAVALKAQSSASYIRQDIIPQTPVIDGVNSDLIVQQRIEDTFNMSGMDVRIAPTEINQTITNGTYKVIDSVSPIEGLDSELGVQFGGSQDNGKFFATESGENNRNTILTNYFSKLSTNNQEGGDLLLKVKHNFSDLPGLSTNQAEFGAALDAEVASPDPTIQDFIAALDYSNLDAVQATFAALDPARTMGLANSVVNSNYRLHRLTEGHLAAIRGKGGEVSQSTPSTTDAKGVITPGVTTTRLAGRANAWGSVSYDGQDNEVAGNNADFDGDSGSFTAGFDWLVAPKLVLGLVLDGSKGGYDGQGSDSDVDSLRGAAYGTWGAGLGFYSNFLVGYGSHDLENDLDAAGILAGVTSSNTDADSLQALWTAGYTMGDARLKHGPFGGFEYQKVDVDGFTQAGPLPISVGDFDVESLRGLIGYRADMDLGTFRPYASVAYAHEFEDGANSATATFGSTSFSAKGADQSSAILIGIGTGIVINESLTLDVGYRGEIAVDDGLTSHGASIGLNYAF